MKAPDNGPEMAARITARARELGISLRELSRRASLAETTAQRMCERLENNLGDVGLGTLTSIAQGLGKDLHWLLTGDDGAPVGVMLRTLPGWPAAAAEAVSRLGADREAVEAVGGWVVDRAPAHLDALTIAGWIRIHKGGA